MSNFCHISQKLIHSAIRPYNTRREGETAAASGDVPCPGLVGRNAVEKTEHFAELMETANKEGAEARKAGLGLISTNDNTYQCKVCHKQDRRDRLLAHVVYKHLGFKTWACPLWFVYFH